MKESFLFFVSERDYFRFSKRMNANCRVVVSYDLFGTHYRYLVGLFGLLSLVNDFDLVKKAVERFFKSGMDKCTIKLRRGLKIEIYAK